MTQKPVALVTGANRGIGFAIADRLVQDGFDLFITGLEAEDGGAAAKLRRDGGLVRYLAGDIADLAVHRTWVDAIATAAGRLDCLVNNAGMGSVVRGDFLDLRPEHFDRIMGVNLRGTMFLTQAALPMMLETTPAPRPRTIVNITSVSAAQVSPERLDYCVSKAALAMWSKGLAVRLAADGIAVFDVRPGIIRSEMTAKVADKYDRIIAQGLVPAGRWGEGADVANAVSALASGDFAFATGTVIDVGGGLAVGRL